MTPRPEPLEPARRVDDATAAAASGTRLVAASTADLSGGVEGDPAAPSRTHVAALDGVRGLAVLGVIIFHASLGMATPTRLDAVMRPILLSGWVGVDLFFALSGFLITGILLDTRGRQHFVRNFVVRRALRIMPLYFAFLALALFVLPALGLLDEAHVRAPREHIGWFVTFLPNVLIARDEWRSVGELGHLWSIGVEEQFYLLWPFLVMAMTPVRFRHLCLGLAIAAPLARVAGILLGLRPLALTVLMPTHMDGLVLGAFAAAALRTGVPAASLLRTAGWGAAAGAATLAVIVIRDGELSGYFLSVQLVGFTAIAAIAAWLVVRAAVPGAQGGPVRAFATRPARLLGDYSYSLYLFHPLVLVGLGKAGLDHAGATQVTGSSTLGALLRIAATLAVSLGIAALTWRLVERPALSLKRHFAS